MIYENEPSYKPNSKERKSGIATPTPYHGMGKLPPQAVDLEEAVLGSLMLERVPDNIWAIIQPQMFYEPRHQTICSALFELKHDNTPIDILTVRARLSSRGELEMIGGAYYLTELTNRVASAANIEYHIAIIHEKFLSRELIRLAHGLTTNCYDDTSNPLQEMGIIVTEINNLKNGIFRRTEKSIAELLIEAKADRLKPKNNGLLGISCGSRGLDHILQGYVGNQLVIVAARPAMGKAQPLTSNVLTPTGFREIGKLKIGDVINSSTGGKQKVTGVFPQGVKQVYTVRFNDGTKTRCCDEHLWLTYSRKERLSKSPPSVKNLKTIREELLIGKDHNRKNHCIDFIKPAFFRKKHLAIHPYLLGVLLGDGCLGHLSITNPEKDVIERAAMFLPSGCVFKEANNKKGGCPEYRIVKNGAGKNNPLQDALKKLGLYNTLSGDKTIPPEYLRSCYEDRLELLRGLIDTDGYIVGNHCIEFSTTSKWINIGIIDLVRSLGGRITSKRKPGGYKKNGVFIETKDYYRINISFTSDIIPVTSKKHLQRYNQSKNKLKKFITHVIPDKKEECVCISVSSPDRLYITDDYILTHNTAWMCSQMLAIGYREEAGKKNEEIPVAGFSLEMSNIPLVYRLLGNVTSIPTTRIKKNELNEHEHERLRYFEDSLSQSPIYLDDTPGLTINEFEAKAAILVATKGVKVIYIDYLQLMLGDPSKKYQNREAEVSDISRRLKRVAKELDITIVALCQLSREVEKRKLNIPMLSDLRESGSIEQDADVVIFLWRPEYYTDIIDQLKELDIRLFNFKLEEFKGLIINIVAKCREEETGKVPLKFDGKIMRVYDHQLVLDFLDNLLAGTQVLTTQEREVEF